MRHCPNADCPYRKRHGHASEFTDAVTECADCGTALAPGEATQTATRLHPYPFLALATTLLAAAASIALTRIPLPGVLPPFGNELDLSKTSIGFLGVTPFLSASILVEFAALAIPRWRKLRTEGRPKLVRATLILTLLLATLQSYGVVTYLQSVFFELTLPTPLLMLTMVAGVFAQLALARLVDRHGLGNGVATLLAAGVAASLFATFTRAFIDTMLDGTTTIIAIACFAGTVLASARWVGRKVGSLRAPLSGIDPVISASALMLVPVTLSNLGLRLPPIAFVVGNTLHTVVFFATVLVLTLALSYLFHRPVPAAARRRALKPTLLYVLLIGGADLLVRRLTHWDGVVTGLALLGVVVLDAYEEAEARRQAARWVPYATLHRTYDLDPLLDRLAKEKIEALPRAVRTRTFFQFFAPWAPIEVLVPAAPAQDV